MDASTFDEICIYCGATDVVPGGWGALEYPCDVQNKDERERIDRARKSPKTSQDT